MTTTNHDQTAPDPASAPGARRRRRPPRRYRTPSSGRSPGSVFAETAGVLISDGRGDTVRLTWDRAHQVAEDLTRLLIARETAALARPDVPPSRRRLPQTPDAQSGRP